jgi:RNA polymerase sigma-70 factor (ECF subfamily)
MDATSPSPEQQEFVALLQRVRGGEESAVHELIRRYERAVLRSVRNRLGKEMRRALDTMDVVQSVHRSLLVGLRHRKYDFASPGQLVALAVLMVRRKIARHWRKLKPQVEAGGAAVPGAAEPPPAEDIACPGPAPPDEAAARDLFQQFLARLDPVDQQLVSLRREGHGTAEIAALLGRDPAFLRMRLARVRRKLREEGLLDQVV